MENTVFNMVWVGGITKGANNHYKPKKKKTKGKTFQLIIATLVEFGCF